MNYENHRKILQVVVAIMLILGFITASFNLIIQGFTPVVWFEIAACGILLVICNEVTQIREITTKKK